MDEQYTIQCMDEFGTWQIARFCEKSSDLEKTKERMLDASIRYPKAKLRIVKRKIFCGKWEPLGEISGAHS